MLACLVPIKVEAQQSTPRKPLTVLISIDGFRPDYLTRDITPTLSKLAREGAVAGSMTPAFPSVTFPNHITLVTGVVPDKHGIVNNVMNDPGIPNKLFRLSDRDVLSDPRWWSEVKPIWVTAHRQKKISSTLFWPGSEVLISGIQPDDWLPYQEIPSQERVTKLLSWLDRPDDGRADFATLYFSEVDTLGHQTGPGSPETNASIQNVDRQIGLFIEGLERLNLKSVTNIVVVSDHGMAETNSDRVINLSELSPNLKPKDIVWTGAFAGVDVKGSDAGEILQAFSKMSNMECWRKAALPARLQFGTHRRIPEVFCLAKVGWTIIANSNAKIIAGQHGYDPEDPDMGAIFIAYGPRIKSMKLGSLRNTEIYGLLCALIGIDPEKEAFSGDLNRVVLAN